MRRRGDAWSGALALYLAPMTEPPDDKLDHYALGFYAPGKGLRREDCPYAEGTEAHARWTAGYDAAVEERTGDAPP
ncbi:MULTISPECIES: ribosome modulation factor [Methylobacterium]|uniref:ribosome modulation factor n=1 Tax=Methylobacterium TaxID=407 RepID=UPI001FAE054F|nr:MULTISPECIES: ribosome modulation factor [Methylobacterium]